VLELFVETRHPCTIITKSAMIERDLDLLADLAADGLVIAFVSVTSLDNRLAARLEPRATAPHRRLETIRRLAQAGVTVGVMVAPVIPMVTDSELEEILARAREAGAARASYTVVRLPHEVKELFREWLAEHLPERAMHVMSLLQQMRGGRDNDPRFGVRMRGEGVFAELLSRRFKVAAGKLGFATGASVPLDTSRFMPPTPQGRLF